jgi:uncharacterized protein (DUF1501 family)
MVLTAGGRGRNQGSAMSHEQCSGCSEYLQLSRRQFLAAGGGTALALGLPAWLPRVALAQEYCSNRDVLVSVFLRGAADGLTTCVPHAEDDYYNARPTLAIPRPDSADPNRVTDLDGFFGFPPAMTPLLTAYNAGHLLIVHASGSKSGTRSHFDAMRFMEVGRPGDPNLFTGWLGRHLATAPPLNPAAILRAVGIGYGLQQTLHSAPKALPVPNLADFGLAGNPATAAARMTALQDMYSLVADPVKTAAQTTQATIDLLGTIDFANYTPQGGAIYPQDDFGFAMKSTAALIKADVGVEAVAIDIPGWDTHNGQGPIQGVMAELMTTLATSLAAFHLDIFAGNGRNVTVLVMSEFGRRVGENGSDGTDHGHGNAMFLLGRNISGGRVLTQWPGLNPAQLFEGIDLQVTIDFRDVLAEIVLRRLGNPNLDIIFPGYTPIFRGVTDSCGRADMNCDGAATVDDAAPFVQALTDAPGYIADHAGCNISNADVNNDGRLDSADIQGFTQAILAP